MRLIASRLAGSCLLLFALSAATLQEKPKISVESDEVVVHVRFTDRYGKAIPDIKKEEVRIFEDGKEQKIKRLLPGEEPFDVALLLDLSPSTYDIQEGIRERSMDFVAQVPEMNRMLLISFDTKIYIDCDWTRDLQKVMDTVAELRTNEKAAGTHLYETVSLVAQKKFPRSAVRKAMIVYTDGIDHGSDGFSRDQSLDIIEESGILVFPIQYDSRAYYRRLYSAGRTRSSTDPDYDPRYPRGRNPNDPRRDPDDRYPEPDEPDDPDPTDPNTLPPPASPPTIGGIILGPTSERGKARHMADQMYKSAKDYLFKLARVSSGKYFETPSISALEIAYSKIIDELAYVYTVTYVPSEKKKDGKVHLIKIDVTRPGVAVLTTKGGYRAK